VSANLSVEGIIMRKLLILSLLLTGCATMGNTPKQDRTNAAWDACQAGGGSATAYS